VGLLEISEDDHRCTRPNNINQTIFGFLEAWVAPPTSRPWLCRWDPKTTEAYSVPEIH
jgi:hypothetical protein